MAIRVLLIDDDRRLHELLDGYLAEQGVSAGDIVVEIGERTVDVHIATLRKKLGDDRRTPQCIRTARGAGYVLTQTPGDAWARDNTPRGARVGFAVRSHARG